MDVFHGTVAYYRRYRPGIPPSVAELLSGVVTRRRPRRLLDVGTGTGLVVEALLSHFDDIIAIDSDADMLAAAEDALRPRLPEGTRLLLQQATAEEFTPLTEWRADLVTICRAFHWLDQAAVLARIDAQVSPAGAVAILGDNSFWAATSPWKAAVRSVVQEFLGEQRRAGSGTFQHHNRPYGDIMRESSFNEVAEVTVPVTRTWTTDSILGYLYSTSFATSHMSATALTSSTRLYARHCRSSATRPPLQKTTSSQSASAAEDTHKLLARLVLRSRCGVTPDPTLLLCLPNRLHEKRCPHLPLYPDAISGLSDDLVRGPFSPWCRWDARRSAHRAGARRR